VIRARLARVAEALEARAAQRHASQETKSAAQEARRSAEEAQDREDLYALAEPADLIAFGLMPE
jgi:ATP-dependent protease Clp ATPase subunit